MLLLVSIPESSSRYNSLARLFFINTSQSLLCNMVKCIVATGELHMVLVIYQQHH